MTMEKKEKCKCPFCENELEMSCFGPAFCEPCSKEEVQPKDKMTIILLPWLLLPQAAIWM